MHPTSLAYAISEIFVCPIKIWGTTIIFGLFCFFLECQWLKHCGTMWKSNGLVSLVVCISTHLVHPTYLTRVIGFCSCVCVCVHLNMRHSFLSGLILFCLRLHNILCTHLTNTFIDMWTFSFNFLIYLFLCVEMKKWYVVSKGDTSQTYL
jgi:hypothetical protein